LKRRTQESIKKGSTVRRDAQKTDVVLKIDRNQTVPVKRGNDLNSRSLKHRMGWEVGEGNKALKKRKEVEKNRLSQQRGTYKFGGQKDGSGGKPGEATKISPKRGGQKTSTPAARGKEMGGRFQRRGQMVVYIHELEEKMRGENLSPAKKLLSHGSVRWGRFIK